MAGKIIADTLETGAGADIATSYVVNGSAKAWVQYNHSSNVVNGSFNTASMTDVSSGIMEQNFTNSMADGDYAAVGIRRTYQLDQHSIDIVQTGKSKAYTYYITGTRGQTNAQDSNYTHIVINGDLA
jgi:hypothetical protein